MNVMLRLHVDLFAGLWGTLFLGFMGVLLIASLVSGTVLYGSFMRTLRFGTVRRSRRAPIRWLDLHNLLGMVTLVWVLVVGVTGIVNTLSIPIFGRWQSTQLAEMTAAARRSRETSRRSAPWRPPAMPRRGRSCPSWHSPATTSRAPITSPRSCRAPRRGRRSCSRPC
jgi:uncharacterized iron-regulated membrane protein